MYDYSHLILYLHETNIRQKLTCTHGCIISEIHLTCGYKHFTLKYLFSASWTKFKYKFDLSMVKSNLKV